jgi:hypothetical protein
MKGTTNVETTLINVTPAIAAEWLQSNTINRPLRRTGVMAWKGIFVRREYRLNHQGIAFSTTGELLDGQHRLTAMTEMPPGFSVPMMVTRGLPPDAGKGMDQGIKRTHSDVLSIPPGLAGVARYLAVIHDTSRASITSQYLIPFVSGIKPAYDDLLSFCAKSCKTWSSTPVRGAAILHLLNRGDADYIKVTYYALNHAEFDSMSPIAQTLFRQHIDGKAQVKGFDMFSRAMKVFDSNQQHLRTLLIKDTASTLEIARDLINQRVLGKPALPKGQTKGGGRAVKRQTVSA